MNYLYFAGSTVILGRANVRSNKFANLTVQDGGTLELQTQYGDVNDVWTLEVEIMLSISEIHVL